MAFIIDTDFHMWFVLGLTLWSVFSYVREKISLEATSIIILIALLLFGQFFPLLDANGHNQLNPYVLFAGFANPSLLAVLALLVMGQAVLHTDVLRPVVSFIMRVDKKWVWFSIAGILIFVMAASAFMNNTPLVIIAIPLLQALAKSANIPQSRVMIPLSFAAILGGMTTLIGSSTNLLVAASVRDLGYTPLGFFDFFVPGSILAGVGFFYVMFIAPRLLPKRTSLSGQLLANSDKQFIAELDVEEESPLIGAECVEGRFSELGDTNVKLIQRAGHLILPPFEGYKIEAGDILIVGASRETLMTVLSKYAGFMFSEDRFGKKDEEETAKEPAKPAIAESVNEDTIKGEVAGEEQEDEEVAEKKQEDADNRILAEVMITPTSRLIDMSVEQSAFNYQFGAVVLGIQRRARIVRRRLGRIRLEGGDVLLIAATQKDLDRMRASEDIIILAGSVRDMPARGKGLLASMIFILTIAFAAFSVLPISISAFVGAMAMIGTGCLSVRQALRALDRKIIILIGAALALGLSLQVTEGAKFVANNLMSLPFANDPLGMACLLFLMVAIFTNLLSNNATAIIFTPIALSLAVDLGVDPMIFAVTVIMGANCSFASPIGYKTNLLVMGPGNYRFRDFIKSGVPLVFLLMGTFYFVAKYYYGL